jgi:cytochrome c2
MRRPHLSAGAPLEARSLALGALLLGAAVVAACSAAAGAEPLPQERQTQDSPTVPGGDPHRGQVAIEGYGCGSCHTIPGVAGARGRVAPPLIGLGDREYIAGSVVNTPDRLVMWIQDPQILRPGTPMPDLGVDQQDARDIAAYLNTRHLN